MLDYIYSTWNLLLIIFFQPSDRYILKVTISRSYATNIVEYKDFWVPYLHLLYPLFPKYAALFAIRKDHGCTCAVFVNFDEVYIDGLSNIAV